MPVSASSKTCPDSAASSSALGHRLGDAAAPAGNGLPDRLRAGRGPVAVLRSRRARSPPRTSASERGPTRAPALRPDRQIRPGGPRAVLSSRRPRARSRRSSAHASRGTAARPRTGGRTPPGRRRERVVAAGAPLRVLPAALDQAARARVPRSSGYIVLGFTSSTPAVTCPRCAPSAGCRSSAPGR